MSGYSFCRPLPDPTQARPYIDVKTLQWDLYNAAGYKHGHHCMRGR